MTDDKLIMAMDMPNAIEALKMAERLGDAVTFYKIGLGMLTSGGLALANELKAEMGKRIFLDMKLFDIGATVEHAVRGIAKFDLDFLTVHGDPYVVRAAKEGAAGKDLKILAVTILTSLDRADLDSALIKPGDIADLVSERAGKAFDAGADGVIASPQEAAVIRALPEASGKLIVTPVCAPRVPMWATKNASPHRHRPLPMVPIMWSWAGPFGPPLPRVMRRFLSWLNWPAHRLNARTLNH